MDITRAEHPCVFETHAQQCVFSFSFYPRPHGSTFGGRICSGAGDVHELTARIGREESLCESGGEVEGQFGVFCFFHSDGGHAEAKKAGVVAVELFFDILGLHEIRQQDFRKFFVLDATGFSSDEEYFLNERMFEAFMQHAFAHHSGSAGDDYIEILHGGFTKKRLNDGGGNKFQR